ncbi:MAG TPA: hypothetical protein VMT43_10170 [Acidimicrobiales bacterium]|nr:hypothetical protein [Acidimicrobiales bacterium]
MAMTHDPTDVSDGAATAVADPAPTPVPGSDQPTVVPDAPEAPALSWAEREVLGALRRLARARANLAAAEAKLVDGDAATFDPADVERLEEVHAELGAARAKAAGRFAKGAARQRVRDLESTERLVLGRLGVASYDDYLALAATREGNHVVESEVIDFARRELASAQQAWREVQALEVVDPDEPVGGTGSDPTPDIDLTSDPS